MRILIIAAHNDDETLGCGGTIARLSAEGNEVRVLVLGEGPSARDGMSNTYRQAIQNSTAAIEYLGGSLWTDGTNGLPDNRFDTIPLLEIAKRIETVVADYCPDVVYTQHGGDLNMDHVITYRATLIATRPMVGSTVKEVYAYPVGSSTEWAFGQFVPAFRPNVFVDITDYLERKIEAMEMYKSERRPFPHPRSPEALRAQARVWGAQAGLMAAEAFELVRCVR